MLRQAAPYFAGFLSGLLATGLILLLSSPPRGEPIELKPLPTAAPLHIHVTGAVSEPGVYTLPRGSIVEQAISAAGGALEPAALQQLNLAAPLKEAQRIYVPKAAELTAMPPEASFSSTSEANSNLLSINEATEPELERLPGIGPSLAKAIVSYRQEHGPFESIDQLTNVPGIGPAKLAGIRDFIQEP